MQLVVMNSAKVAATANLAVVGEGRERALHERRPNLQMDFFRYAKRLPETFKSRYTASHFNNRKSLFGKDE